MGSHISSLLTLAISIVILFLLVFGAYHLNIYLDTLALYRVIEESPVEDPLFRGWALFVPGGAIFLTAIIFMLFVRFARVAEDLEEKQSEERKLKSLEGIYACAIANALGEFSVSRGQEYAPGDVLRHMSWLQEKHDQGMSQKNLVPALTDRIKRDHLDSDKDGS